MAGSLIVEKDRCTGCRLCEIVCSLTKEGVSDPARSRIRVLEDGEGGFLLAVCQQCEEGACTLVCPVNAVCWSETTGEILFDRERCVGCRACVSACPLLGSRFDRRQGKGLRCDLCGGEPACVAYCAPGALRYGDRDECRIAAQRTAARKIYHQVNGGRIRRYGCS
jgi:anaerobic carbon-monoxide dehydrogenase iron sulfur subunit